MREHQVQEGPIRKKLLEIAAEFCGGVGEEMGEGLDLGEFVAAYRRDAHS